MAVRIKGVKIKFVVDSEESLIALYEKGLLHMKDGKIFVLSTDAIVSSFSELQRWKTAYEEEKQKVKFLEDKLRNLELDMKLRALADSIKSSTSVEDRDDKGRFIKGHLVDLSRDSHGRFLKKSKEDPVVEKNE